MWPADQSAPSMLIVHQTKHAKGWSVWIPAPACVASMPSAKSLITSLPAPVTKAILETRSPHADWSPSVSSHFSFFDPFLNLILHFQFWFSSQKMNIAFISKIDINNIIYLQLLLLLLMRIHVNQILVDQTPILQEELGTDVIAPACLKWLDHRPTADLNVTSTLIVRQTRPVSVGSVRIPVPACVVSMPTAGSGITFLYACVTVATLEILSLSVTE